MDVQEHAAGIRRLVHDFNNLLLVIGGHCELVSAQCADLPQAKADLDVVADAVVRATGLTERCVADQLGITHTAAQRAAALQRLLDQRGLQDPYELLSEPPADYTRIRRHKHSRFDQRKPVE